MDSLPSLGVTDNPGDGPFKGGSADLAPDCHCMAPPIDYRDYDSEEIGVDTTRGRFAEISLDRCKQCGRQWLDYHYELEAFSRSGRWYRGLLTPEQAKEATAGGALEMLAALPWHFFGGSYYDTSGKRSEVPLDPSLA